MAIRSVDDVAAVLYAVAPSAFVAARTEAARAAREAGDRQVAAAIAKLRRPAVAAWAVNLLARDDVVGLTRLLTLGEDLREAQQQLRGEALLRLSRQRHEVLAALTRRARELAGDAGHPLGGQATQQVTETLSAALADPNAARDVQSGRLVAPLSYAGFGPATTVARPSSWPERDHSAGTAAPRKDELAQRRERREQELATARREVLPLAREAQGAAEDLERADNAVADAQRRLDAATEQRDAAARRARVAEHARRDAEDRVQRLTEQLDEPG